MRDGPRVQFFAMGDPAAGKGGTYYVPFPVLALASNGGEIFCTAGGGGSTANKEVPNVVHAQSYREETGKLSTVAALNTGKSLVVSLTHCPANDLWLASSRNGTKVLSLNLAQNTITELCEWPTESEGKEPEQNVARFSPDASLIVTGGTDGLVKVWKAEKPPALPVLMRTCGTKTKEILDVDFSPDSKFVAACDGAGGCRFWEVAKEDPEDGVVINYTSSAVKGKVFIKLVRFLPTESGKVTLVLGASGPRGPALVGLFGPDGTKLKEVNVDKQPIKSMALDSSNTRLVVGLMCGAKAVYTCPGLKLIKKTKELHSLPAQGVAFVGEGTAVSGSGDRDLHLLNMKGGGGSPFCYFFILLFALIAIGFMVFRIADKGAALGQGKGEL